MFFDEKIKMDFLCVGFSKCGTTSLHKALEQNEKIALPKYKETQFVSALNKAQNSEEERIMWEKFCGFYDNNLEGKLVGGIEPSYYYFSNEVYQIFGGGLKLLFCVRNPADTLFADFLVHARNGIDKYILERMKTGEEVSSDMFDGWVRSYIDKDTKKYIKYINKWQSLYDKRNMYICIMELMKSQPQKLLNDIEAFIGITENDRSGLKIFPHENSNRLVPKNYDMALLMREFTNEKYWLMDVQERFERKSRRDELYKKTMKEADFVMNDSTREYLMNYFKDSICELETFMERSLDGIWY